MHARNLLPVALLAIVVVAFVFAGPASAFTIKTFVVTVHENGDADIRAGYQLSWPELFVYYVTPMKEDLVKTAIGSRYPKLAVTDVHVLPDSADLTLKKFAEVSRSATVPVTTTYTTRAVSFLIAKEILDEYPDIAKFLSPDFSPEMTIVKFPGGREYSYKNANGIPALSATIMG